MFSRATLIFALVAFSCVAFAFQPLSFIQGFNNKLNLQDNKQINDCIYRLFMMNSQAKATQLRGPFPEADIECVEAFETYFEALMALVSSDENTMTSQQTVVTAVGSTHEIFERLSNDNNFAAGQEAAALFTSFASILNLTAENRLEYEAFVPVNTTALLLGLNEQLQIIDLENFADCISDETQVSLLVKSVITAVQQHRFDQAIESISEIVRLVPGLRSTCVATLQGFEAFFNPIVKTYKSNPKVFFQAIKANIVSSHFQIATQLIGCVQQLQKGNDYEAGVTVGKVIQTLLQGI